MTLDAEVAKELSQKTEKLIKNRKFNWMISLIGRYLVADIRTEDSFYYRNGQISNGNLEMQPDTGVLSHPDNEFFEGAILAVHPCSTNYQATGIAVDTKTYGIPVNIAPDRLRSGIKKKEWYVVDEEWLRFLQENGITVDTAIADFETLHTYHGKIKKDVAQRRYGGLFVKGPNGFFVPAYEGNNVEKRIDGIIITDRNQGVALVSFPSESLKIDVLDTEGIKTRVIGTTTYLDVPYGSYAIINSTRKRPLYIYPRQQSSR